MSGFFLGFLSSSEGTKQSQLQLLVASKPIRRIFAPFESQIQSQLLAENSGMLKSQSFPPPLFPILALKVASGLFSCEGDCGRCTAVPSGLNPHAATNDCHFNFEESTRKGKGNVIRKSEPHSQN